MLRWHDAAEGWIREARRVDSPNFDQRPAGLAVDCLIIHYISLPPGVFSGDTVERLFLNQLDPGADPRLADLEGLRVSAHFMIRRRGELLQFVATTDRAWHAGPSLLLGRERVNDFSIGVELEGDGSHTFTSSQYRRLSQLVQLLRQRHPLVHVAGHSDVAPGRKHDPGPMFDWARVLKDEAFAGVSRPF